MLYGKLPILLLAELVEHPANATNALISAYILNHLEEARSLSIKELAANCFVSTASITRFCRDIGLNGYSDLRDLIAQTDLKFDIASNAPSPNIQTKEYVSSVIESISMVRDSLNMAQIARLVQDIHSFKRVAVFGTLKAATTAINLQTNLLMLGKLVYTCIPYSEQMEYIENATEEDLIIIFSFRGVYFNYKYHQNYLPASIKKPKIYFITGNPFIKKSDYLDDVICFKSKQDQASHPYQLQITADIIAQEYAHLCNTQKQEQPL